MKFAKFLRKALKAMDNDRAFLQERLSIDSATFDGWLSGDITPPLRKLKKLRIQAIQSSWQSRRDMEEIKSRHKMMQADLKGIEQECQTAQFLLEKLNNSITPRIIKHPNWMDQSLADWEMQKKEKFWEE